MNRDELLDQLYATRRRLTVLIAKTAVENVDPDALHSLVVQRDRIVWLINQFILADISASMADTEAALQRLGAAADELSQLRSSADDLAKAIDVTKTIVSIASGLLGAGK